VQSMTDALFHHGGREAGTIPKAQRRRYKRRKSFASRVVSKHFL